MPSKPKPLSMERQKHRAKAALKKISTQYPEKGAMFFALLERTVLDLFIHDWRGPAVAYLNEDMWHSEISGVDPDWIRDTLRKMGVCFSRDCRASARFHINHDCLHAWNSVVLPPKWNAEDRINARPDTIKQAITAAASTKYRDIAHVRANNYGCADYEQNKQEVLLKLSSLLAQA